MQSERPGSSVYKRTIGRVREAVSTRAKLPLYSVFPAFTTPRPDEILKSQLQAFPRLMLSRFEPLDLSGPRYPAPETPSASVSVPKTRAHGFERYPINFCPRWGLQNNDPRSMLPILMGNPVIPSPGLTSMILDWSP